MPTITTHTATIVVVRDAQAQAETGSLITAVCYGV